MKNVIEGWYHEPGRHCASTALRDAARYWGLDWNEALCFGLGRGLGAFYINHKDLSPSRWLMTRAADLEDKFFGSLTIPFEWKLDGDGKSAFENAKKHIDDGVPILLHTDIAHLDYYNTNTHFNRHAVLMWGYDEEEGRAYLSDTQFKGLMEVPLESLDRARSSAYPPGPVKYDHYPFRKPTPGRPIEEAALDAVRTGAFELLGPGPDYPLKIGLGALSALADDLPSWSEAEDWKWAARFSYQTIEKRGTGGSGFRSMYADFLAQVEDFHPAIKELKLSEKMGEIASEWSTLASLLKEISEMDKPARLEEASAMARNIHDLEKEYCETVLGNVLPLK